MGDENPIRTLGDYSKPSHEGYLNTIELPVGNNVAITDRIAGALPSDMGKNSKLNTSPVLSARSYPTIDPQCSSHPSNSINAIKAHFQGGNHFPNKPMDTQDYNRTTTTRRAQTNS
ncbi:hypothetical protein Tco_0833058 [Tanacetum coccineum]